MAQHRLKAFAFLFSAALLAALPAAAQEPKAAAGLPKLPDETAEDRDAYRDATQSLLSMTPDEIREFRKMIDARQKAAAETPHKVPLARNRSIDVALSPGDKNPEVQVWFGYNTTIAIFDITGQPWQILKFSNGNEKEISVEAPIESGHFLSIRPKQPYASGNLTVFLKGMRVPLTIDMNGKGEELDSGANLRIAMRGPDSATLTAAESGPPSVGNPVLAAFLQGIPPSDAEMLAVHGADARAWRYKGHYYIQTRDVILSPGTTDQSHDADVGLYEIDPIPAVLMSVGGRRVEVRLEPLDETDPRSQKRDVSFR